MGDPAELRHPGGHDHAAHGFALAALLENRKSLTDEREPMLELRVHGTSLRSLVTTRKYTLLYVRQQREPPELLAQVAASVLMFRKLTYRPQSDRTPFTAEEVRSSGTRG